MLFKKVHDVIPTKVGIHKLSRNSGFPLLRE